MKEYNNMPGRASFTTEERRKLIHEFQASGMTQAAFCREWSLNSKTPARWLRLDRQKSEVLFCELDARHNTAADVRICFPNRIEVTVPAVSTEQLGIILREAATCLG